MEVLALTAGGPDRNLAAAAAEHAAQIAHSVDPFDLDQQEIQRATVRGHRSAWLAIAANEDAWVDIRIYALDVAARLDALLRLFGEANSPSLWQSFLSASDPQMRSAASTLVPRSAQLDERLRALLVGDEPEEVAISAAKRLCGPLRVESTATPTLNPAELSRVQKLSRVKALPIVWRAQLAPCLVADGSLDSRRALGVLLQQSPPALRRHLSALTSAQSAAPQK